MSPCHTHDPKNLHIEEIYELICLPLKFARLGPDSEVEQLKCSFSLVSNV